MIPFGGTIKNAQVQEQEQPSYTWKLDFKSGRITGNIDELEAIKQAVFKILQTERYSYLIYSFDYGSQLEHLIGKNPLLARSEVTRIIQEALSQDDRIERVENIQIDIQGDNMTVRFIVVTLFGSFEFSQEVAQRV